MDVLIHQEDLHKLPPRERLSKIHTTPPTCVRAEVHRELAGVAAGVGADLALERPLVVVNAQVLLQAAAVCGCVGAVLALVRLLARVGAAVHVELVPPTEALVTQLAFKRLFTWMRRRRKKNLRKCQMLVESRPEQDNRMHLCAF